MVPAVYRCFARLNFTLGRSGKNKHGEVNLKSSHDISGFDTLRMNLHRSFEPDVLFFCFSFFVWPLSSPKELRCEARQKVPNLLVKKIIRTGKQHHL